MSIFEAQAKVHPLRDLSLMNLALTSSNVLKKDSINAIGDENLKTNALGIEKQLKT